MRLIDADDMKKHIEGNNNNGIKTIMEWIDNQPTIEPQRMRGKWIWKGEEGDSRFSCSVCKCRENVPTCNGIPDIWNYCPNCGCQMNGDEEDEQ